MNPCPAGSSREVEFTCTHCRRTVVRYGLQPSRKYCSTECGVIARGERLRSAYPGLATSTVGAIGELRVSVDLLARGYPVFRALSASCPCDLAMLVKGKLIRVEVKTGYKNKRGALLFPTSSTKPENFDILAIVVGDEIVYRPGLPALSELATQEHRNDQDT